MPDPAEGDNVVSMSSKQEEFEGMPIRKRKFAIRSGSDLTTPKELRPGMRVDFTGAGLVVGVNFKAKRADGEWERVTVIEADEVDLV